MTALKCSLTVGFLLGWVLIGGACARKDDPNKPAAELLPVEDSPLVSFRILLKVGSSLDPAGREGLCQLTLALLANGGTRSLTYQEITRRFYPMAAEVDVSVDKEMSVFTGTIHRDNLEGYYALLRDMLLDPGFREEDFTRVKTNQLNFLERTLVGNMDEQFGKEILNLALYEGHPFGHQEAGTVESLQAITLEDVRAFYKQHFLQGNFILGLAGGYPQGFPERVISDFAVLPEGRTPALFLPEPKPPRGLEFVMAEKDTPATAISLGFPVSLTRADDDFFALWLAVAHFGEHRQHVSHLFQKIREERGQNYGDYAYAEHFDQGRDKFPDTNYGRRQQYFSIWIRPLQNENRHFVIRQTLRELRAFVEEGLSQERFELVRTYLLNYTKLYAQTLSERLGWRMDSRYYGYQDFLHEAQERLPGLTRERVNRAVKKYLNFQNVRIAVVTKDAGKLRDDLLAGVPSPITYANPNMPAAVLAEDKVIEIYPLEVRPENIRIAPAADFFKKPGVPGRH